MRIDEIATPDGGADPNKLLGLVQFLSGRATDTAAQKQISQDAFITMAQDLGINVTDQNLPEIVGSPPLNGVLEPLDQKSGMITFKGANIGPAKMTIPQAQQVVSKMAKSAMKRPM